MCRYGVEYALHEVAEVLDRRRSAGRRPESHERRPVRGREHRVHAADLDVVRGVAGILGEARRRGRLAYRDTSPPGTARARPARPRRRLSGARARRASRGTRRRPVRGSCPRCARSARSSPSTAPRTARASGGERPARGRARPAALGQLVLGGASAGPSSAGARLVGVTHVALPLRCRSGRRPWRRPPATAGAGVARRPWRRRRSEAPERDDPRETRIRIGRCAGSPSPTKRSWNRGSSAVSSSPRPGGRRLRFPHARRG